MRAPSGAASQPPSGGTTRQPTGGSTMPPSWGTPAPRTEIAAHRGGAALWPENSAAAFRGALRLGVEQVEFDVQRTADGVPVIFHDAALERMTDGAGPLAERSLAELRALTLAGGGRILTLEEGLGILAGGDVALRCEVKPGPGMRPYPGLLGQTLDALRGLGLLGRTVLTSFHLPTCAGAAGEPALRDVLWLLADPVLRLTSPDHVARLALGEGVGAVAPALRQLDDATLSALLGAGVRTSAFAVLEDAEIERALDLRLPVFTTDRPDAALRLRAARGPEPA